LQATRVQYAAAAISHPVIPDGPEFMLALMAASMSLSRSSPATDEEASATLGAPAAQGSRR